MSRVGTSGSALRPRQARERRPRQVPPWRRSAGEGPIPPDQRRVSVLEIVLICLVVGAIIATAVWFFVFSTGGIGPGTV